MNPILETYHPATTMMTNAIRMVDESIRLAEQGDLTRAETLLAEAEAVADRALSEPPNAVPPDVRELLRAAWSALAPSPDERVEPLDSDQYPRDVAWHARMLAVCRRSGSNQRILYRQPSAAERRLFHKPGWRIREVEVFVDSDGTWSRRARYSPAWPDREPTAEIHRQMGDRA